MIGLLFGSALKRFVGSYVTEWVDEELRATWMSVGDACGVLACALFIAIILAL